MITDKNGNQRQMSIYEYLFIHAHRLHHKKLLRRINSHRREEKSVIKKNTNKKKSEFNMIEKAVTEHKEDEQTYDGSNNKPHELPKNKMFQRALGLFTRLEVTDKGVLCNCENFSRFGTCEDSKLIAFICLGKIGWPKDDANVNFSSTKGSYDDAAKKLRMKILGHVHNIENHSNLPPKIDPMKM